MRRFRFICIPVPIYGAPLSVTLGVKTMITRLLIVLLFCQIVRAGEPSLQRVRSGEELARFVFSVTTKTPVFAELLKGLESTNAVRIASDDSPIPIREIYGTIIDDRFHVIPYQSGKHHSVREICSFLHFDGLVYRYHITVYEDKEYVLMKDFLRAKMAKKTKPNKGGAANRSQPVGSERNRTSAAAGSGG